MEAFKTLPIHVITKEVAHTIAGLRQLDATFILQWLLSAQGNEC